MSYSYTIAETTTFALSHARHIGAKVATDLKRMQRFYGEPSDSDIADYETEVTELLRAGYIGTVIYGFRRNALWIVPTLRYTARDLAGASANDDDPGSIRPRENIEDASFGSYLTYSESWNSLTSTQQEEFKQMLPVKRVGAPEPDMDGYWSDDRTYSSGGRALDRKSLRRHW